MNWYYEPPDPRCDVCGNVSDDCVCPECPVCGTPGDPECYTNHGMERTEEQISAAIRNDPNEDYDGWLDPPPTTAPPT